MSELILQCTLDSMFYWIERCYLHWPCAKGLVQRAFFYWIILYLLFISLSNSVHFGHLRVRDYFWKVKRIFETQKLFFDSFVTFIKVLFLIIKVFKRSLLLLEISYQTLIKLTFLGKNLQEVEAKVNVLSEWCKSIGLLVSYW